MALRWLLDTISDPAVASVLDLGDAALLVERGAAAHAGAERAVAVPDDPAVLILLDEGDTGPELTKLSAMAKLYCTDVAMEVSTDAVQVLGGYGYISEYPLERMMRDAKITQIYEGTNQIHRLIVADDLLG